MTVLFSGEPVSLSNTADVPSGVGLVDQAPWLYLPFPLTPVTYHGWESYFFKRNLRASGSGKQAHGEWQTLFALGSEVIERHVCLPPYSACWLSLEGLPCRRGGWGMSGDSSVGKGATRWLFNGIQQLLSKILPCVSLCAGFVRLREGGLDGCLRGHSSRRTSVELCLFGGKQVSTGGTQRKKGRFLWTIMKVSSALNYLGWWTAGRGHTPLPVSALNKN